MKEILREIIKIYFGNTNNLYDFGENLFLVIDNEKGEPSDFFYFIFNDDILSLKIDDFSSVCNELKQKKIESENIILEEIESFDKNLNIIIFSKIDDDGIGKINETLQKKAYGIEDDAYYARKKVMFYTQSQVDSFDNYSLNLRYIKGSIENEIKNSDNRFLLNLLSTLTFVKIEFKNSSSKDNNIFEDSFNTLNKDINIFDEDLNLVSPEDLSHKIIEINNKKYKEEDLNISKLEISKFEKDLIGMFNNSNNLEENILSSLISEKDEK